MWLLHDSACNTFLRVSTSCVPAQGLAWGPFSSCLAVGQAGKTVQLWQLRQETSTTVHVARGRSRNALFVAGWGAASLILLYGRHTLGYRRMLLHWRVQEGAYWHPQQYMVLPQPQPLQQQAREGHVQRSFVFVAGTGSVGPLLSHDKELCLALVCEDTLPDLRYELAVIRLRTGQLERHELVRAPVHLAWAPDGTAALVLFASPWDVQQDYLLVRFVR